MKKRRYLGQSKHIKTATVSVIRVDKEDLKGSVATVQIHEVNNQIVENGICFHADGFSRIEFMPDHENWALTAIYDEEGKIVEWYFDMTKENGIDDGRPYIEDLYLDIALFPDGRVVVLDEDELQDALDSGEITVAEFELAYQSLAKLKASGVLTVEYMTNFCARLKELF